MNRSIWLAFASVIFLSGCGTVSPMQIGPNSLPDGAVRQAYRAQLRASGVRPPLNWTVASGHLPPGIRLAPSNGILSGTPLSQGEFDFTVEVSEVSAPEIKVLSPKKIRVRRHGQSSALMVTTDALPGGTVQGAYSANLSATGGTPPYVWSIVSGSLPPGILISASTGGLSGTPTTAGQFSFTAEVQDSSPTAESAWATLGITIASAGSTLQISTTSLPGGTEQAAYSGLLSATGGNLPYSWSISSGSLAPGIGLGALTGALSGTPAASGQFSFTAKVQDSVNHSASRSLSISIALATPSLEINTTSLPAGVVQVAYAAALSATGGKTPYSWSVVGGTFPVGLTLDPSSGAIRGTPTRAGSFVFTAQVKDSSGQSASASLNASIAPPAAPVVSSISPKSGPTTGGTTVTVSGSNFASGATVSFGGVASSASVVSASEIQAVSPAHIAGTVDVSVQVSGQSFTLNSSFTYTAKAPTVSGVSPTSGPAAGGTSVTITGANFVAGAVVLFGTASASNVTVVSGTKITAVTPASATGPVSVTVRDPGNLSAALSAGFTYTSSLPAISNVSPNSGPAGTQVTITGTNFESGATVSFGSTTASLVVFVSATKLEASVPTLPAGTYTVTVDDPGSGSTTLPNAFIVPASTSSSTNHYLYVLSPGPVVTVYDIDNSFAQTKQISAGTSTAEIRGAVASAAGNFLYISYGCHSPDECTPYLMKYDLLSDSMVWNNVFSPGIDSHAITPDGKTIYMPTGEDDQYHSLWYKIDTSNGNISGTVDSGVTAPHNTIVSNDGAHVYMGGIGLDTNGDGQNHLARAHVSDGSLSQRIGPVFGDKTRPFTIDSKEQHAFIVPFGMNGFQVGSISSGQILFTANVAGFSNSKCTAIVTCSHGISLSPDGTEIYVVDYYSNYVHVFSVSGLPSSAPAQIADIPLKHPYTASGAWVTHSRDGRFVFVGQSGDVIDTSTRQIVGYIPALNRTKVYTEIDFQNGVVSFAPLSRSGVGYSQ